MVSSAASILLTDKGKLVRAAQREQLGSEAQKPRFSSLGVELNYETFFRIPPFPQARFANFIVSRETTVDASTLLTGIRRLRVGGTYWAAQPELPTSYVLVRSLDDAETVSRIFPDQLAVLWSERSAAKGFGDSIVQVSGECDPWHMLARATALVSHKADEVSQIAALLGVPCFELCGDRAIETRPDPTEIVQGLASTTFANPFFGSPMNAIEAAELCGFWRELIDRNRKFSGGVGFAFWKQDHVAPLLWGGGAPFKFLRNAEVGAGNPTVAIWRAKAAPALVSQLERSGCELVEVEDGFLRSQGLGADCIPPLSITVDRLGPHFDPRQPSELELLVQNGQFDATMIERARDLRRLIVDAGIGKYERTSIRVARHAGDRRHILVPGQVEDDRAVTAGGCGLTSNLELLKRVREQAPDAFILYKPHPDVLAGHRRGAIAETTCLRYADTIVGELPITGLIAMVDEVHVNTSLAGFEALLREKKVTTYGVPFYAGWGLTDDLGPVPSRRTARRTLDELVAATLLLYPRYLDPLTRLPCPAEVVVARLSAAENGKANMLVGMRRLQGKLMRRIRSVI